MTYPLNTNVNLRVASTITEDCLRNCQTFNLFFPNVVKWSKIHICLTILQHFKRKGYITELSVKIVLLEIFERVLNTSLNILVVMKH